MSTLSEQLARDINSILDELTPENIAEMDYDEIIKYRKELNVYGRTIEGSNKYLSFSFTNLSEKYIEKLVQTAMVGFLNRMCDEWHVPDGLPVIPVYDYVRDPESITRFAENWPKNDKVDREVQENAEWMKKRVVVKEFLEEMFQYNPDKHVRSVYKPNPRDVERKILDTPAANLAIRELKKKDVKFREQMLEFDRVQKLLSMRDQNTQDNKELDYTVDQMAERKLIHPEYHYSSMNFETWSDEDKNVLNTVCNMLPPADIFNKYRYYLEANYDKLREAVQYLYCDKPDFDIAINPYQWHDTEEEAFEFQKKHKNEVIADVIKADSGKWNFFAPFAKVRDSMRYFNKDTAVLEEITEQIERDAKLGKELVQNRMYQKKKKNIAEEGPDAEAFTKWKATNAALRDLGAESLNMESYANDECPDDAVQCDVFRISADGNMKKDHFYTKAYAPDLGGEEKQ